VNVRDLTGVVAWHVRGPATREIARAVLGELFA